MFVYKFSGRTPEDILIWSRGLLDVIQHKPCKTLTSRYNITKVLLERDALVSWKDFVNSVSNTVIICIDDKRKMTEKKVGRTESSFKTCLRQFFKELFSKET